MNILLSVFLGGGLGSLLRYGVQQLVQDRVGAACYPWSTFLINVSGSFLIGLFYAVSERLNLSAETRLFLTMGLCGGFTTFSTFSNESLLMLKQGDWFICLVYIIFSVVVGISACFAGGWMGKSML